MNKKNKCVECEYCKLIAVRSRKGRIYGCEYSISPKYPDSYACKKHYKEK